MTVYVAAWEGHRFVIVENVEDALTLNIGDYAIVITPFEIFTLVDERRHVENEVRSTIS